MKFITTLCIIAALATVALASSASWGKRNGTDYLLYREDVFRYPAKNQQWSVSVQFPHTGQANYRVITAIYVYDQFRNSSGAAPSLWSGGPRYTYATVNLKSQKSRGIQSTVEIYGR